MEATKWLKPSVSGSRIGDRASVQAATRVNAEQASKRTMRNRAAIFDPLSTELADHPVRGGLNDSYTLKLFPGGEEAQQLFATLQATSKRLLTPIKHHTPHRPSLGSTIKNTPEKERLPGYRTACGRPIVPPRNHDAPRRRRSRAGERAHRASHFGFGLRFMLISLQGHRNDSAVPREGVT
jgi:hypothetical protein